MSDHIYNENFYDYIDQGSQDSASVVSKLILEHMDIASLLDVGGGHGAWGSQWLRAGVSNVLVVDGDYVDTAQLAVPATNFIAHDLLQPLKLGQKFDLVQSLEVAEHLPHSSAQQFVDSLIEHGDVILFSAAVPFQGGEHHVNEQELDYWRTFFAERGYDAFDFIRPAVAGNKQVKPWYRFNSLIYANEIGQKRMSDTMRATRLDASSAVPNVGDLSWTARRAVVRFMPSTLVKNIAMKKAAIEAKFRPRTQ